MLKALPKGGKCMGFVGLLGADNARERIEGVKKTIKGSKIELVDVRGDDIDQTRAKRNVEDTLTAHPEVNCMVGFDSYNRRASTRREGSRQAREDTIIGFDEDPITLGGVKEGTIAAPSCSSPMKGLSGHEGHGEVPRGRQIVRAGEQPDHHPDQDHRQGECRRLLGGAEGAAGKK